MKRKENTDYDKTIFYINSRLKFGIKPGLIRIKKLLELMGNPQDDLKFIHVGGTNGKGSICTILSSILVQAGYKTGLFTSPYVTDFKERFKINSEMIEKKCLIRILNEIKPFVDEMDKIGEPITEFELISAIAFQWFKENNCDIVVLEVGLGGTFDATNVIKESLVNVITSISRDHMEILGNTLEKITENKLGILRKNGAVVVYPDQNFKVLNMIKERAELLNNKIFIPDVSEIVINFSDLRGSDFMYKKISYFMSLLGEHQIVNCATALEVIHYLNYLNFKITAGDVLKALKNISFVSRLEMLSKEPLIILDGAHNVGGALILKRFIESNFKNKKITAVIGMLRDKEVDEFLSILGPLFFKIIAVSPRNIRAMDGYKLKDFASNYCKKIVVKESLEDVVTEILYCEDIILICGSLYLSGDIRSIIMDKIYNKN